MPNRCFLFAPCYRIKELTFCALAAVTSGCSVGADADRSAVRPNPTSLPALDAPPLSPRAFLGHLTALAHDSMQGRGTGQPGGDMAADYIERAFQDLGLEPIPGSDTYRQEVPILGTRIDPSSIAAAIQGSGSNANLDPRQLRVVAHVDAAGVEWTTPLVFVGAGVVVPAGEWDDYAGKDVDGAFVVMDDTRTPAPLAESVRTGAYELTRTARATAARRRGARGVVTLSAPGSEPRFDEARASDLLFEQLSAGDPTTNGVVDVQLGPLATQALLSAAHTTFEDVAAGTIPSGELKLSLSFSLDSRTFTAPNIVGVVEGTGDEIVVVTAHYDAYGLGPRNATGDSIYNGAADNASGTAGLIELARGLVDRPAAPERSVVFVATTAEERGKLGARYYADHPVGDWDAVVVNINVDGLGFSPPTEDFALFPSSGIEAMGALSELAGPLGMRYGPQAWHEGMHFSFDTEPFLTRGVPALTVWQGQNIREAFRDAGRGGGPIHTPDDELTASWPEAGIEQHLDLYRRILEYYSDGGDVPPFSDDHPFGAGPG